MTSPPLRLRPLTVEDGPAALHAHAAMLAEDFHFLLFYDPREDWSAYLARLEANRSGPIDRLAVPATFLAAAVDGALVGRISVRHELDEWLSLRGGHIGYGVLPEQRRRGYATEILRQGLVVARAAGIDRVLVTCDDDNAASARTIEACGGQLESIVPDEPSGKPLRRYWID